MKQFRVMQTDVLGLSESVKSGSADAGDADRNARFPIEVIDAPKAANPVSCSLPADFRGRSSRILSLAMTARAWGSACGSGGIVIGMRRSPALTGAVCARDGEIENGTAKPAANVMLFASAAAGAATGGDLGSPSCAISVDGTNVLLTMHAPVISSADSADEQVWIWLVLGIPSPCTSAATVVLACYTLCAAAWLCIAGAAVNKACIAVGAAQ